MEAEKPTLVEDELGNPLHFLQESDNCVVCIKQYNTHKRGE